MRAPTIAFPALLQDFFLRRLIEQRGVSARTVESYRDAFELLLGFAERRTGKRASALSLEVRQTVNRSVLAACDAHDGAKDGILENPQACTFDPQVLVCREGTDPSACLTAAQVAAVKKTYAGASNPRTGEAIFPGLERGSELGWSAQPVGYAVD